MKTNKKKEGKQADVKPQPSRKLLKTDPKGWQVQYPAKVGYHGTDEEKELSPEE